MHNLVPDFILQQTNTAGSLSTVTLFVDTSGFTPLTQVLMAHGTEGAETIADALNTVFTPLVDTVYVHGGFVAGFAGDALKAVFPLDRPNAPHHAISAAWQMQQHLAQQPTIDTPYGTFPFTMTATLAVGDVRWEIWEGDGQRQRAAYLFAGEALDAALVADQFVEAGEIVLTDSLRQLLTNVPCTQVADGYWRVESVESSASLAVMTSADPIRTATDYYPATLINATQRGEFRPVVSVFVNVQGSAPLDALFELLGQYDGYLCRIGRIGNKDAGTTLLLFWGAPVAHENDAVYALRFLSDLQAANPNATMRAGVTTGIAYAGFIGSARREEYTCHGTTVNLAARQMVSAEWGAIWVDGETMRRADHAFHHQSLGERQFKGVESPQPVYRVQGQRVREVAAEFRGAMVGREREIRRLAQLIAPIFEQKNGGFVVVIGEAGIGKSRLLAEFATTLTTRPTIFIGQCDERLRQSLHPLRYWLRGYFQQSARAAEATNKSQFTARLNSLIERTVDPTLRAELWRTRSMLGALVDLYWDDSLYAQIEPEHRFENSLDALKTLIKAESHQRPLILTIEDVHWIDADSLTFLQQLRRNVGDYPFVIVATARQTTLLTDANIEFAALLLNVLNRGEIEQFAAKLLNQPASPALIELLLTRSDGNPFFAEQLLHYWHDVGALTVTGDGVVFDSADTSLTADVRSVLIARLDRLTEQVRAVVQTAAILGREFEVQLLRLLLQDKLDLQNSIAIAQKEAIWDAIAQLRYLFKHALLRDAAYEMQLQARRQQLHLSAVEAIEQIYADNLPPHYDELAYHAEQARDESRIRNYLYLAGVSAQEAFQNYAALDYFERLLPYVEAAQPLRYADALYRRGVVTARIGRFSEAVEILEDALKIPTDVVLRANIQLELARIAHERSDLETAREKAQALLVDEVADKYPVLVGRAYLSLTYIHNLQGDYTTARQSAETALQQFMKEPDQGYWQAYALKAMARTAWEQSDFDETLKHSHAAYQLHHAIGNLTGQSDAHMMIGIAHIRRGENALARQFLESSLQYAKAAGSKLGIAQLNSNLGNVAYAAEDNEAAITYYQTAYQLNHELDRPMGLAISEANLGLTFGRMGRFREALDYDERALGRFKHVGNRAGIAMLIGNIGVIHWMMGAFETGLQFHLEGLAIDEELGNRDGQGRHHVNIANCYRGMQEYEKAIAHYDHAITLLSEIQARTHWCQALVTKARVLIDLGRSVEANAANDEGLEIARFTARTDMIVQGEINVAILLAGQVGVAHLEQFLQAETHSADAQANIHYALWQLGGQEHYREKALAYYIDRIAEMEIPYHEHTVRVAILESG